MRLQHKSYQPSSKCVIASNASKELAHYLAFSSLVFSQARWLCVKGNSTTNLHPNVVMLVKLARS